MSSKLSPKERVWRIGIIVILILIVLVCMGIVVWCWIWGEREKYRNRDEKRRLRELRQRVYNTQPIPAGIPPMGAYSVP